MRKLEIRSSEFNRRPAKPGPIPEWLNDLTLFQRLMCAAKLFRRANETAQAERFCRIGLEVAKDEDEIARANRSLGDVYQVSSVAASNRQAERHLTQAVKLYAKSNESELLIDGKLELANVYRRMHDYPRAVESAREAEELLHSAELADEFRRRIAPRLHLMYGLILGLSGSSEVADKSAAIEHLRKAVKAGEAAGLVTTRCSVLNSLGLVTYQIAGRSVENLREAEGFLQEAFDLNTFTGDARACFQQLRNLGLVHTKLAQHSGDADERHAFLEKALADYQRAGTFLERLPKGGAMGELLETRFRADEVLVALDRKGEAEVALAEVCERRMKLSDWHNEARTLELLLQTTDNTAVLQARADRICEIYHAVLDSPDLLESFKTYPIRLANAVSIVDRANSVASAQGFTELASSLREIRTNLDQWRREHLDKTAPQSTWQ